MFNALVLNSVDGKTQSQVSQLSESDLPENDVLIDVAYSSLNYKDGLAVTGKGKVVRQFPMVPGIDCVGTVLKSADSRYAPGDHVILTGWGVGESHWGGMSQQMSAKGDWLVKLPAGLTPKHAMTIGTAGLTAMLCVQALLDGGLTLDAGDVLVTGASGGVGSVAVALLAKLGFSVIALTGRVEENEEWLKSLGASRVIDRNELLTEERIPPLESQSWVGAIDTVGGQLLSRVLGQMKYGSTVAACGLAGSASLPTTVMPFILRNVRLQGVDSVYCHIAHRIKAWEHLANLLTDNYFDKASTEISLSEVPEYADAILAGQVKGRVVVNLSK